MESAFRDFAVAQQEADLQTMKGLQTVAELQVASMYMLREVDEKLTTLSQIAWNVQSYLERREAKDEFLGDLRLVLIGFEDALDSIDVIAETHLEYATLQVEVLQGLVQEHDVRFQHFKTMMSDEIKWAKGVLARIDATHRDFLGRLGDE